MAVVEHGESPGAPARPGAIYGAVLLVGTGLAAGWLALGLPLPACALKAWTGVPCPTCGSTRLGEALLRGDVVTAIAWNPLVFSGLTSIAIWSAVSLVAAALGRPEPRLSPGRRTRVTLRVAAVAALVAGWVYVIGRGV